MFLMKLKLVFSTLGLKDFAYCWRTTEEYRNSSSSLDLVIQLSENQYRQAANIYNSYIGYMAYRIMHIIHAHSIHHRLW